MARNRNHVLGSRVPSANTRWSEGRGERLPETFGRLWYVATAAAAFVGIALIVIVSIQANGGSADSLALAGPIARALHIFFFWTTVSNLMVGFTFLLLATNPRRTSTAFWAFHLLGLTAIIITGIVSNTILPRVAPLFAGLLGMGVDLVHIVAPIMAVIGWLLFGPSGHYSWHLIPLASLFLPLYGVVTLIRGAIINFYPYPFLDVSAVGYGRVFINMTVFIVSFVAIAAALVWLDRARSGNP